MDDLSEFEQNLELRRIGRRCLLAEDVFSGIQGVERILIVKSVGSPYDMSRTLSVRAAHSSRLDTHQCIRHRRPEYVEDCMVSHAYGILDVSHLIREESSVAAIRLYVLVTVDVLIDKLLCTFSATRTHCDDFVRHIRGVATVRWQISGLGRDIRHKGQIYVVGSTNRS